MTERRPVSPRVPSGFPEWLPEKRARELCWLDSVRAAFECHGFSNVQTPLIELSEILLAKSGDDTDKQVYRLTRGKRELCIPFDWTVPLARYVAQHKGDLVFPFRAYQIGRVCRGESAQVGKGRFRMFYQCDADVLGASSALADAEVIALGAEVFRGLGVGGFSIHLNHRKILTGLYRGFGIANPTPFLRIMDKQEKLSEDDLRKELSEAGADSPLADRLLAVARLKGDVETVLEEVKELSAAPTDVDFVEGLNRLSGVTTCLKDLGLSAQHFLVDLSVARGLDYYTGTVFETSLDTHPDLGSVASGGRYDNLTGYYSKMAIPGIGISLGLTRLFDRLFQTGAIAAGQRSPSRVLVTNLGAQVLPLALRLATAFRSAGVNCEVFPEDRRLKQQLKYAQKLGIPFVAILGVREKEEGAFQLKDLRTGTQSSVPLDSELPELLAVTES